MRPGYYWGIMALIGCIITGNAYFKTQAEPEAVASSGVEEKSGKSQNAQLYVGMAKVPPQKVAQLFPEAKQKPLLLMFHSKFCYDCKRMKPVIEKALPKHPGLVFKSYDILEDKKRFAPVFNAFKPVTVPILVFITPEGAIRQVLYNYQSPQTVEAEILATLKSTTTKKSKAEPVSKK